MGVAGRERDMLPRSDPGAIPTPTRATWVHEIHVSTVLHSGRATTDSRRPPIMHVRQG